MFLGGGMAEDRLPSMNHHPKFGIREEALEAGVRTEVLDCEAEARLAREG